MFKTWHQCFVGNEVTHTHTHTHSPLFHTRMRAHTHSTPDCKVVSWMTANGYAYDIKQAEGLGQELVDAQKIHYLLGSKARSARDPFYYAYMHTNQLSLSRSSSFPLPLPIPHSSLHSSSFRNVYLFYRWADAKAGAAKKIRRSKSLPEMDHSGSLSPRGGSLSPRAGSLSLQDWSCCNVLSTWRSPFILVPCYRLSDVHSLSLQGWGCCNALSTWRFQRQTAQPGSTTTRWRPSAD